jgi:2-iminobutanoate/2-iminopropanoate deaminase
MGDWTAPDVSAQTRQCLANIRTILEELGLTMASIVKTTVFLAEPNDFKAMNEAYKEFFPEDPPARSPAKLGIESPGLKVAIEAIAVYEPREEE